MSKQSIYQIHLPPINDDNIKEIIGKYIYSLIDMKKYKYIIVNTINDLQLLTKQKYYVSLNFCGLNCYYVFLKIKEKYYSVLVDKKTINYNQTTCQNIKMYDTNIKLDDTVYNGSIFDGIFIDNENKFIVNDVYHFRGTKLIDDKLTNKMINIKVFLEITLKKIDNCDNIMISNNKFFELYDIKKITDAPIMKKKHIVRGLLFYPEISGITLIYILNNKQSEINNETKINNEMCENKLLTSQIQQNKYTVRTEAEITAIFEIRKTNITDVYKLYLATTEIKNGKPILKGKKIDIASIPTIECKKLCSSIFDDTENTQEMKLVKCIFNKSNNKWIPIERDLTKKYPTLLSELDNILEINECQ